MILALIYLIMVAVGAPREATMFCARVAFWELFSEGMIGIGIIVGK